MDIEHPSCLPRVKGSAAEKIRTAGVDITPVHTPPLPQRVSRSSHLEGSPGLDKGMIRSVPIIRNAQTVRPYGQNRVSSDDHEIDRNQQKRPAELAFSNVGTAGFEPTTP